MSFRISWICVILDLLSSHLFLPIWHNFFHRRGAWSLCCRRMRNFPAYQYRCVSTARLQTGCIHRCSARLWKTTFEALIIATVRFTRSLVLDYRWLSLGKRLQELDSQRTHKSYRNMNFSLSKSRTEHYVSKTSFNSNSDVQSIQKTNVRVVEYFKQIRLRNVLEWYIHFWSLSFSLSLSLSLPPSLSLHLVYRLLLQSTQHLLYFSHLINISLIQEISRWGLIYNFPRNPAEYFREN